MFRTRRNRSLIAWIATCAIVLGALAPAVTHALAWLARGNADAIEQLAEPSPEGHAVAHTAADASHRDTHHGHRAERDPKDDQARGGHEGGGHGAAGSGHCPFCGTHAGSVGLPPIEFPAFAAPATASFLPHLYHRAPRPLFAWTVAPPRAPPART